MSEKLLNVREASEYLGISSKKVEELVRKGKLPAYKIGGTYLRFRKEQIKTMKSVLTRGLWDGKVSARAPASRRGNSLSSVGIRADKSRTGIPDYAEESNYALIDKVKDFFYFNDFYFISIIVIVLILIIIFKS